MHNLSNQQICGHVHDELIIECPEDTDVSSITAVMGKLPDWIPDILIRGDGYETKFYKKIKNQAASGSLPEAAWYIIVF